MCPGAGLRAVTMLETASWTGNGVVLGKARGKLGGRVRNKKERNKRRKIGLQEGGSRLKLLLSGRKE